MSVPELYMPNGVTQNQIQSNWRQQLQYIHMGVMLLQLLPIASYYIFSTTNAIKTLNRIEYFYCFDHPSSYCARQRRVEEELNEKLFHHQYTVVNDVVDI